jgi:nucleotide-binding universal stress UspA family protein
MILYTPSAFQRDDDGRLTGLIFDSTPPLVTPDINPWLIAVDHSDNALLAVTHAASLAGNLNACALHMIHVQTWLSKEAAETELAHHGLEATARARALLDKKGLPWRLHVTMGDPVECIIELAARLDATGIMVGSSHLNFIETLLGESVIDKLVHQSPVPVLVVP